MAKSVRVGQVSDLKPGECKVVEADGKQIGLFNVGGKFYAIDNTCKHRGGPLGEGELEGPVVTCPWHGWQYDVTSGACKTNPAVTQTAFPVQVQGSDLVVEI